MRSEYKLKYIFAIGLGKMSEGISNAGRMVKLARIVECKEIHNKAVPQVLRASVGCSLRL